MGCGGHHLLLLTALWAVAFRPASMQRFGDVRLTGYGASTRAGRVELFDGSRWWSICNDGFDGRDANVVCSQLGLGYAVRIVNIDLDASTKFIDEYGYIQGTRDLLVGRYGIGPSIGVDNLQCRGSESHILQCPFVADNDCYPWEAVGVQCSDYRPQPYSGEVRLVGGEFPSEGRLEVYFNGEWGGVCREVLEQKAADTACRQLGYTHAENVTSSQEGVGAMVWLSSLSCQEGASCLSACLGGGAPSAQTTCNGSTAALVCGYDTAQSEATQFGSKDQCVLESLPGNGSLRLVDGPRENEGRVEVYLNSEWGTVCGLEAQFSRGAADVLCRQLGYHTWTRRVFRSQFEGYGSSAGPMHLTSLDCSGGEGSWEECHWESATFSPCTAGDAVGVECSTSVDRVPHGGVALRLGSGGHGLLLVANSSTGLHPVCDATFGMTEGHVACRQMGYTGAIAVRHNSYYGRISIPISISHIHCNGNESHLLECQFRNHSPSETDCTDNDLVGLQCFTGGAEGYGELRLAGSDANSSSGRLEVWVDGKWHPICSFQFSPEAGDVACRQLGYSGALRVIDDGRFGGSDGDGIFYVPSCQGWESKLVDCDHIPVAREYCGRDVAVECSLAPLMSEGRLRLVGGASVSEGRLEVYRFGSWGTVCSHQFDAKDGEVACRELGYYGVESIRVNNVSVTPTSLPINIHLTFCHGNESRLINCAHEMSPWRCNHSMDVGLVCRVDAPTTSLPPTTVEVDAPTTSPPPTTVKVPNNPSTPLSAGVVAGLSVVSVMAVLVIIFLILCVVLLVVFAERRRRRRRRWEKEESDWMPGVSDVSDIKFVNPKYDNSVAPACQI